ncbi:MAG: hypothetical protein AAF664_04800 [Planctomycetota bacterium]
MPKTLMSFAILLLVGFYTAFAPAIERRTGLDLPQLTIGSDGGVEIAKTKTDSTVASAVSDTAVKEKQRSKSSTETKPEAPARSNRGPLAERMRKSRESSSSQNQKNQAREASTDQARGPPLYGFLREVGSQRYMSPGGLLYTPGSAEGHRLKHVARHIEDQPSRPGKHGVFDGGMEKALLVIDRAYERAQKKQRTTTFKEDGRIIHTVDMGSRVGFIGGREGNQKRKPMARRVRLVLDGNRIITAFPL